MRFEKLSQEQNVWEKLYNNDRESFKESVKAAYEQSLNGGYMVGTPTFMKMIKGNMILSIDEYSQLKKEVKIMITEIKKNFGDARNDNTEAKDAIVKSNYSHYAKDAEEHQRAEMGRTGIHPEDLNEE